MTDSSDPKVKRPASQYYWGDWWKDKALHSCSQPSRGLWHEMNCLMHEGEPYGHLTLNGKPMQPAQLANLCRITTSRCKSMLDELEDAGVFSRADSGSIYSRRMVRDEDIRTRRANAGQAGAEHGIKGAEHGAKGGRPKKERGDEKPPLETPLEPPPSSSSSSSSSASAINTLSLSAESPRPSDRVPDIDLLGHQLNGHAPKTVPDCPHLEILALWAEVMPDLPQHDPDHWPESARADHLRARWRATAALKGWASKDDGLRYFRKLFGFCRNSDFLMGKAQSRDRRPFEFELAWLVNATNWTKVHEGKFHG